MRAKGFFPIMASRQRPDVVSVAKGGTEVVQPSFGQGAASGDGRNFFLEHLKFVEASILDVPLGPVAQVHQPWAFSLSLICEYNFPIPTLLHLGGGSVKPDRGSTYYFL
jgi:hypothetical protein